MLTHPDSILPDTELRIAYTDLLAILARDEPDALARAMTTVESGLELPRSAHADVSPAGSLARAWLGFAGHPAPSGPGEAEVYTFTYPAHVVFDIRCAGGPGTAKLLARRCMVNLTESDSPFGAFAGPFPADRRMENVVVWLGSRTQKDDVPELELTGT